MPNKSIYSCLLFLFILSSCGSEDDTSDSGDSFYDGALDSVKENDLYGTWAIFNLGFEGDIFEVPVNYEECGRDFMVLAENSVYTDYLYLDSGCEYMINSLNWNLDSGIVTLTNEFQQSDEWVITAMSNDRFTFKARLDIDDDGVLDLITFFVQRYQPVEIDVITPTFARNQDEAFENLISFTWQPYDGLYNFDRYEIYRSSGGNCALSSAELIFTGTDISETEFTDLTPPAEEDLCYYLKVYTDQGLYGESFGRYVNTGFILPAPVNLNEPEVSGNSAINFSWEPSEDPYFSHYELAFSNFGGGSGYGQQEYSVAIIEDRNSTNYQDNAPPLLNKPYYVLYVHNIFGNKTRFSNTSATSFWQVDIKRDEIIELSSIRFYAVDDDEPVVYLYGKVLDEYNDSNIHRFNYQTNQTEAVANVPPTVSTTVSMKLIDAGYGDELIFVQGSELHVYDAEDLQFKYALDPGANVSLIHDFDYSANGYWLISDSDNIYSFSRDNRNFEFIHEAPHFSEYPNYTNYQIFALKDNKVVLGHNDQNKSLLYKLENDGQIVQEGLVDIAIRDEWDHLSAYNASGDFIISYFENRIYSTTTYDLLQSFGAPYNASGLSLDGSEIYGSNNDPEWQVQSQSPHNKEAVRFNRISQEVSTTTTIGYPHLLFEDYQGNVISISSGLKKNGLRDNINDTADFFVEIISFD
jgi:hypothetical protein